MSLPNKTKRPQQHGIELKKALGQHFLRDEQVIEEMLARVHIDSTTSVFEIGCGDGFLTRALVQKTPARLWVFEIDPAWAAQVQTTYADAQTTIFNKDILEFDWQRFTEHAPWVLMANLPYQITFPILHLLHEHAALLREGVIMIQEEVAQKLVATYGRKYGLQSLFFQHAFELKLLRKISPAAFYPPPRVFSRLVYFKPRAVRDNIPDEENFWVFIKRCFSQPRRTLKNNLLPFQYNLALLDEATLLLRAQQMSKAQFLEVWNKIR